MKTMLTIPGHKENKIKTTLRFHFTTVIMAIIKNTKTTNIAEDVEKKELSYTAGRNVS
jgi:hypothetical protein